MRAGQRNAGVYSGTRYPALVVVLRSHLRSCDPGGTLYPSRQEYCGPD